MWRFIRYVALLAIVGGGLWWLWNHYDEIKIDELRSKVRLPNFAHEVTILTFEATSSPDELMQKYQKDLLHDQNHTFGKATIKFLPCALFDIKYQKEDKSTEEARLLWSLDNGEIILDTRTFETTHGFEDFIRAGAKDEDFRILFLLMKHGGQASRDTLVEELGIDPDTVIEKLDSLRRKHLVAAYGDLIRIHLAAPLFKVKPESQIPNHIVTKKTSSDALSSATYSKEQIKKIAKAAFGLDFAIRGENIIYIPIVEIDIQNPDGSVLKTYWNGLNGKKITLSSLLD
jgi:hypothetical protein